MRKPISRVRSVGPPLHHLHALLPVLCPGAGTTNVDVLNAGQLPLDGIRMRGARRASRSWSMRDG